MLLSSMHHTEVTDERINKPEIIGFYNATKGGVDTLDMKCNNYSVNRNTRRWPLAILYHLIAVACSNAHTLHSMFEATKDLKRYDFTKEVAYGLIHNHVKKRLEIPNLPQDLRKKILEAAEEGAKWREETLQRRPSTSNFSNEGGGRPSPRNDKLDRRVTCRFCPYQKKKKKERRGISA